MRVHVMSKKSFDDLMRSNGIDNDNVEDQKDTFFVSINNTSSESTYFTDKANVKVMFFDDTETDLDVPIIGTGKTEHKKAFTPDQARDLFRFIESHADKATCIVHCAAGISRSGAVGTFISDFNGCDWFEFKRTNPQVQPNGLVLRLLKNEANF